MSINEINSTGSEDNWSDSFESWSTDDEAEEIGPHSNMDWRKYDPSYTLVGNSPILCELSVDISKVWREVGRYLGIKECIIENIDLDHERRSEQEKAFQLLLTWTRKCGSAATFYDLKQALEKIEKSADISISRTSVRGSERAERHERKLHMKQQRQVMKKLKEALLFYQERLKDVDDFQNTVFEGREERELKRELDELDKNVVQQKLDSLQQQIYQMQEKDQSELDQQLRLVADKLYELDKTFKQFNDALDDLNVFYYSQIECNFIGLCYFKHIKFPRGSSSGKHSRTSRRGDEELEDDVFQDGPVHVRRTPKRRRGLNRNTLYRSSLGKLFHPTRPRKKPTPHPHRGQEEHTKRKLSVSIIDIDEVFQLQDFVTKFCRRYRQERPFVFEHCCMNLQRSRGEFETHAQAFDCNTLPTPRYQSTEEIVSLVTRPFGSHRTSGIFNMVSDLV